MANSLIRARLAEPIYNGAIGWHADAQAILKIQEILGIWSGWLTVSESTHSHAADNVVLV